MHIVIGGDIMKGKKGRNAGEEMEENAITLEEIVAFYEKYGIATNEQTECPSMPSAFEDIPLQFSSTTT